MLKAGTPRAAASLHAFLVPGMLDTTIAEALELLHASCDEMRESAILCRRLYERFTFLRLQVEDKPTGTIIQRSTIVRYGACVGDCTRLFAKYSQKTELLGRLVANRRLLEEIERLHQRLDSFFVLVHLATRPEMTLWSKEWQNDLKEQHHLFSQTWVSWMEEFGRLPIRQRRSAVNEESILEIKFELAIHEQKSIEHRMLLQDVLTFLAPLATSDHDVLMPKNDIPSWFIPRDEVLYQQQHFALGGSGALHRGSRRRRLNAGKDIKVVVKCLYSGSEQTQAAVVREATLWSQLNHPNVLKLVGACHVGKPLLIVTEDAGESCNFVQFLNSREANKQKLWSLFAEVAEGLAHLHRSGIVHNNLKCSNLLVSATDAKAKVIDFGSSIIVNSQEEGERPTSPGPWTAPELLVASGGKPRRPNSQSDIYSLGVSIVEALKGGDLSWWETSLHVNAFLGIRVNLKRHRIDGLNDRQWELVQSMCASNPLNRPTMTDVIKKLSDLANNYSNESSTTKICVTCSSSNPGANCFCNECGTRFPQVPPPSPSEKR
ncbi:Serine/threonine protein kinase, partial [Globisporangium splendens]